MFLNLHFKVFLQDIQHIHQAFYQAKTFGSQMCKNFRSPAVFLTRQILDIPKVDPVFQQMGGKTVAQPMDRHMLFDSCFGKGKRGGMKMNECRVK